MSDYLGNLVARTLRPSSAVRPRLELSLVGSSRRAAPAEFEPATHEPAPEPAAANDFEIPETRTNEPNQRAATGSVRRSAAPRAADRLNDPVRRPSDPAATHVPLDSPIAAASVDMVQPAPIAEEIAEHPTAIVPQGLDAPSTPDDAPENPLHIEVPRAERTSPLSLEHRIVPIPQPAGLATPPHLHSFVIEARADRGPVQACGIPARTTARRTGRPAPDVLPQTRLGDQRLTAPNVPAPEPTIQVTIGRIEVRATATSPAIKPARAVRQSMSLEDYLRSRAKGASRE